MKKTYASYRKKRGKKTKVIALREVQNLIKAEKILGERQRVFHCTLRNESHQQTESLEEQTKAGRDKTEEVQVVSRGENDA